MPMPKITGRRTSIPMDTFDQPEPLALTQDVDVDVEKPRTRSFKPLNADDQ